ncbi:MAG: SH3-like domain-containing protein [Pseudomonadota bacterium]
MAAAKTAAPRSDRESAAAPAHAVGDRVLAHLAAPAGHTRLPQYVRGRNGTIIALHGAHLLPNDTVRDRPTAEPLHTVSFALADLFAELAGSRGCVHLEIWERFLDRAP